MSDTALTVLLLADGTAWRCHTTTESHPDRRPCGWCVRLPDALVESLSAHHPTEQSAADPPDVDILWAHQWDWKTKGCACGWHQRNLAPRGMERRNHPEHVAHMLHTRSMLYPPSAEFARRRGAVS